MTSAREREAWVEGYEAPIKRALWERIYELRRAASLGDPVDGVLSVRRAARHGGVGVYVAHGPGRSCG